MKTILKPFALCAAISMPTNLLAEELTADDYTDPRSHNERGSRAL